MNEDKENIELGDTSKPKFEYGIEHFNNIYETPLRLLRYVGLRIDRPTDSPLVKRISDIYYNMMFVNLVFIMGLESTDAIQKANKGTFDAVVQVFKVLPCLGYDIMALTKTFNIMYHREVFDNIVRELRAWWPRGQLSEEEYSIISSSTRHLSLFLKIYYWCNIVLISLFLAAPVVELIRHELDHNVELILPFFFWFPFDPFTRGLYEIILIWMSYSGWATVIMLLSSDLVFCIFLAQITMQFELLAVTVGKLEYVEEDQQSRRSYMPGNNMRWSDSEMKHRQQLTQIIGRHRLLIRLANDVEAMFSFSVLVNCCVCSVNLCFCGFCVVIVEKWYETTYKFFLVTSLTQVAMLCWYGQRLKDASNSIGDALYNSGWYQAPKKIRSFILIMICRSQKEVHVTAYGFTVICLRSYTSIIKTAWSYFMLILNVYNK